MSLLIIFLVFLKVNCIAARDDCGREEFRCDDGECVGLTDACDGWPDCDDSSDELKCNSENSPTCRRGFFQCKSSKRCILHSWICDDEDDCHDGSDEVNCSTSDCLHFEFECLKNEQCIHRSMRCDGMIECEDGSDELNCNDLSNYCNNKHFPCEEIRSCIPRQLWCDGKDDCQDGSDEKHCNSTENLSRTVSSVNPETLGHSCPGNYCTQNAECVVINGQYYCNCPPKFTGEKCEVSINAHSNSLDLGIVIAVSAVSVSLFVIISTLIFCYCKRKSKGYSSDLMSKSESQIPITTYSKKQDQSTISKK